MTNPTKISPKRPVSDEEDEGPVEKHHKHRRHHQHHHGSTSAKKGYGGVSYRFLWGVFIAGLVLLVIMECWGVESLRVEDTEVFKLGQHQQSSLTGRRVASRLSETFDSLLSSFEADFRYYQRMFTVYNTTLGTLSHRHFQRLLQKKSLVPPSTSVAGTASYSAAMSGSNTNSPVGTTVSKLSPFITQLLYTPAVSAAAERRWLLSGISCHETPVALGPAVDPSTILLSGDSLALGLGYCPGTTVTSTSVSALFQPLATTPLEYSSVLQLPDVGTREIVNHLYVTKLLPLMSASPQQPSAVLINMDQTSYGQNRNPFLTFLSPPLPALPLHAIPVQTADLSSVLMTTVDEMRRSARGSMAPSLHFLRVMGQTLAVSTTNDPGTDAQRHVFSTSQYAPLVESAINSLETDATESVMLEDTFSVTALRLPTFASHSSGSTLLYANTAQETAPWFYVIVVALDSNDSVNRPPGSLVYVPILATMFIVVSLALAGELLYRIYVSLIQPMNDVVDTCEEVSALEFRCLDNDQDALLRNQQLSEMKTLTKSFYAMVENVSAFSKYLSKEVLRDLSRSGALVSRAMRPAKITILFSDIAGFTTMCETLTTVDLMELAGRYFNVNAKTLQLHAATIDKYIGDAIMALWGAPLAYQHQGFSACAAALHMQTVIDRLRPFFSEYQLNLQIRIGIHQGNVLVGNLGCSSRVAYTALGSNVHLSAKLEEINKRNHTDVTVSETVLLDADATHKDIFIRRCVGQEGNERVFELVGVRKSEMGNLPREGGDDQHQQRQQRGSMGALKSPTSPRAPLSPIKASSALSDDSSEDLEVLEIGTPTEHSGSFSDTESRRSTYTEKLYESTQELNEKASVEKKATLSLAEELSVLHPGYYLPQHVCLTFRSLSNAQLAALAKNYDEAYTLLGYALEDQAEILETYSVHIPTLEKEWRQWGKKCSQETRAQFHGKPARQTSTSDVVVGIGGRNSSGLKHQPAPVLAGRQGGGALIKQATPSGKKKVIRSEEIMSPSGDVMVVTFEEEVDDDDDAPSAPGGGGGPGAGAAAGAAARRGSKPEPKDDSQPQQQQRRESDQRRQSETDEAVFGLRVLSPQGPGSNDESFESPAVYDPNRPSTPSSSQSSLASPVFGFSGRVQSPPPPGARPSSGFATFSGTSRLGGSGAMPE